MQSSSILSSAQSDSRIKVKNQYTSSILKFKLNNKIQHNVAVAALTQNKIPQLESLAEDIRQTKTKSMMFFDNDSKPKPRTQMDHNKAASQVRQIKTAVISPGVQGGGGQDAQGNNSQCIDPYIVGDSVSSMSSIMDDEAEDYYSQSIVVSAMVKEPEDLVDKDLINLLAFIKRLNMPTDAEISGKLLEFGELSRHKTLIFDLDETLIHSQMITQNQEQEIVKDFEISLSNNVKFGVAVRPYVQQCLEHLSSYYEMAIFTAAEQQYADLIIDRIDPEKKYFSQRLYRQHCLKIDDVYVKDLRIISDRPAEDTIIVDNSILSFAFQLDNGVPMCAFLATNNQDQELLYLITYLEEVYHLKDCRTANKKTFKLTEMMNKSYAVQFKFGDLDDMEHAHIPYSIVLIHILEKWKTAHDGQIPKTEAEKEEFRQIIKHTSRNFSKELNFIEAFDNAFKCFKQPEIRYTLEEIFEDPKIQDKNETSSFWILCAALQRYYTTHGLLPLSGKLPDMTSTTDFYLALQRIYQEKALEDMEEFIVNLQQIMTERGVAHESISLEDIKLFCQNSQILEVTRFRSPKEEIENPDYSDFVNEMYDNESVAPWYVCMRAVEQFRMRNGRYPGLHDSQLDQDFQSVRQEVSGIMSQIMSDGSLRIEDKYIKEIVRYSDSKIHTVAAFLGGVASQEAIKLLIQQYTPFNHTFVYDGIHHRCQTFSI